MLSTFSCRCESLTCLHLLQSQATHHLHHHHHHHHEVAGPEVAEQGLHGDQEENLDGVWKGLTALSGVYVMFLIEHFLTLGKMYKDRKKVGGSLTGSQLKFAGGLNHFSLSKGKRLLVLKIVCAAVLFF